jgi:hypothetical protein
MDFLFRECQRTGLCEKYFEAGGGGGGPKKNNWKHQWGKERKEIFDQVK